MYESQKVFFEIVIVPNIRIYGVKEKYSSEMPGNTE